MSEMITRVAMWLHQRSAEENDAAHVPWPDVPDERKAVLEASAKDLIAPLRRLTLGMRV